MTRVAVCVLVCIIFIATSYAKPSGRVVGGVNASEGQFPHQISLRSYGSHKCGGSIISPNFILTAAYCVFPSHNNGTIFTLPPSVFSIRAGSTDRFSGGVLAFVTEVIAHENYGNFLNNVALLKLREPLVFSKNIAAIPIATAEVPPGEPVIISGWGSIKTDGDLPEKLQWNTLTAISRSECKEKINWDSDSLICLAHEPNNGACSGDTGGPALYNGQVVGIANNFVDTDCGTKYPDGFTKVFYHHAWIRKHARL